MLMTDYEKEFGIFAALKSNDQPNLITFGVIKDFPESCSISKIFDEIIMETNIFQLADDKNRI